MQCLMEIIALFIAACMVRTMKEPNTRPNKELLSETFDVNLITLPRHFGKTLTMSMLAEFLDIRKDSRELFEGLTVAQDKEFCEKWMNQWSVLFLTLKDVNGAEFDVPLAKASDNGYYEKMLEVIRSFLGMAWKSNPSLKFAVITGCLRVAKESIFTGANNFGR